MNKSVAKFHYRHAIAPLPVTLDGRGLSKRTGIHCAGFIIQTMALLENLVAKCEHLKQANPKVKPNSNVCQECVEAGHQWVELRQCLVCGNVACCDSSPGRHATKHFNETGHAVMQAYQAGDWKWCYVHESYL